MTKKETKKKTKRKTTPAFLKIMKASPALAKVVGKSNISRSQAMKVFWAYVEKKRLQDKKDRRNINLDAHLKPLFGGKKQVNRSEVDKVIRKNMKHNKVSKKILLQQSTETAIEMCNRVIENKQLRKQNILFIKAANGKRIRNTSGV